jgi:Protein of unknown function (DUF4238)
MLPPTPKNQHYVWQHYLEAWVVGGKIACYRQRDRKPLRTNPKNIASESYFYRVYDLNDHESAYLEAVIASRPNKWAQETHRNFLKLFQLTGKLRAFLAVHGKKDAPTLAASEALLDQAERSLGESYHVAVENKGAPLLALLRLRDASFWLNAEDASDFAYFIATQYMRTARMRNAVVSAIAVRGLDLSRVWSIESHFWATEIGAALFGSRDRYRAVILTNDTAVSFIAGDQPAVNMNAPEEPDMKLFYPVAPNTALMLTVDPAESSRNVTQIEAEHLNHAIYRWSDDQIYGVDPAYLSDISGLDKSFFS